MSAGSALMAFLALAAHSPSDPPSDAQIAKIQQIVRAEMSQSRVPGMALGVGLNGNVIYARGFGIRAPRRVVDDKTIFPIGSITKQFTAACVMQLVQAGRVRLDDPIATYLTNVPHV